MTLAITAVSAIACFLMTGITWFVQIVHYPLFRLIGESSFMEYHRYHMRRTSYVVAPIMIVELLSALILLLIEAPAGSKPLIWMSAIAVILVWAMTFFVQVPAHRQLRLKFDGDMIDLLVRSNSIRLLLWSFRSFVMIYLFIVIVV